MRPRVFGCIFKDEVRKNRKRYESNRKEGKRDEEQGVGERGRMKRRTTEREGETDRQIERRKRERGTREDARDVHRKKGEAANPAYWIMNPRQEITHTS
jgi:hypothetical protein